MKKTTKAIVTLAVCVLPGIGLIGCGNQNGGGNNGGGSTDNGGNVTKPVPTASQIVSARNSSAAETVQGYDFTLDFSGDFGILGIGTSLGGKYDGSYRYNGDTDEVSFKRKTSGALLYDSTCYVMSSGDNRIKATMDGNAVKKLSVEIPEEQNITMVNLPFVAFVDSIQESNIGYITVKSNSAYAYSCRLSMGKSNPVFSVLSKVFEKLGTGVSFKGIDMATDMSTFDFNIVDGKLDDFHMNFKMDIGVKAAKVALNVDYIQKKNNVPITLPNFTDSGFIFTERDVQTEINAINTAISDLKDDPVYSLDLTAKNEFDPGWNKTAIVDSYNARMYKKTESNTDWFNHSYYYKAHSETAGKETYKYTLGNVNGTDEENQGTWLISRKGSNMQTRVENVSADTQFDFLTDVIKQNASEIDCIKKKVVGTTTRYSLFIGNAATKSLQKKIIDMINTNPYDEVIAVDNYFNSDNIIKDASIEIVIENNKIASVVCDTELCYTPLGGDYTEYNITLNNVIELNVNKHFDKAQKNAPPTKVKGNVLGIGKNLNDSEYYIL